MRTGVADPEIGSAGIATNFRRNRVRGQLEIVDGVGTNLGFTPTILGTSSLVPIAHKSFFVADQGGRVVTAMLATYAKTAVGYGSPLSFSTAGVFTRPYYSGGTWVDDWQETTEVQVVRYVSATGSVITISNSPATGLATNQLAGWTLVLSGSFALTSNTGFLITANTASTITIVGDAADLTGWIGSTTVLYAFRNIHSKLIPASIQRQFRNVLDEIRINTGNSASDLDISVFYRDKTFFQGIASARKGTFSEYGQIDVPSPAFKLRNAVVTATVPGWAAGSYAFKASMLMDDGQETELRDALVGAFSDTLLRVNDTPLGANIKLIDTNGTNIFAATQIDLTTGTSYIFRLNTDNAQDTGFFPMALATYGTPIAIACRGGFLYVMALNVLNQIALLKFDESLNFITRGTFTAAAYSTFFAAGANDTAFFTVSSSGAAMVVYQHNFSTLNLAATSNVQAVASIPNTVVANATYVITTGYTGGKAYKWSATALNASNPTTDATAALSGGGESATILSGIAYVGSGSDLFKWVLSSDTITSFVSLIGVGGSWFGAVNDGTFIYESIAGTISKINLSGTVVATVTDGAPLTAVNRIAVMGRAVFGLTSEGISRRYSNIPAGTAFVSDGNVTPTFDLAISPGYVPRRAKAVRIYTSVGGGAFYLAKELSILSGGVTFQASSIFDATIQHRYYVALANNLTAQDLTDATISAILELGRTQSDTGINRYSYAITANNRTYAVGLFIGGRLIRNKVYVNAVSGDSGISMFDVLPNDSANVLDVEFNDGDYALALGNVADRVLVLKNRSLVMLTPNADGSHNRDIVATGIGIAAINSLVTFNEAIMWLDHSGVWQFTTSGLKKLSAAIDYDLFVLYTNAERAAAIATVDAKNMQYRIFIKDTIYVCDLADNEWMMETGASQLWFDNDLGFGDLSSASQGANSASARRFTQLRGANIETPKEDTFAGTSTWETSRIELPLERGYDGLLSALYIDYDMQGTTPTLTFSLYINEESTARKIFTAPAGRYEATVPAPLAARCKTFRLRVTAVTSAAQKLKIRRLGAYFNQIPVGGDQQTV